MTLVPLPAGGLARVDWTLPDYGTFAVHNQWSGAAVIGDTGGVRAGWSAKVTVVPVTAADRAAWTGFFAALRGVAGRFALGLVEAAQTNFGAALVDGAATPGGFALALRGLPPNTVPLQAGALITAWSAADAAQAFVLTAPLVADATGRAVAAVDTKPRAAFADGAAVTLDRPVAVMRLTAPKPGWAATPGQIYVPTAFSAEEAF